jgi:hypothetical protein
MVVDEQSLMDQHQAPPPPPQQQPYHEDADAEFAAMDAPGALSRKLPELAHGNLVLVVLFAVGALLVYLLSLRGGPEPASAQSSRDVIRVDAALKKLRVVNPDEEKSSAVVSTFYYEARERQIGFGDLKGNPFVYQPPKREELAAAQADRQRDAERRRELEARKRQLEAQRRAQALESVKKLKLESVMITGRGRVAVLSGDLAMQGQKMHGWTVDEIRERSVRMTRDDISYVLRIE